jgi:hypothetical protein
LIFVLLAITTCQSVYAGYTVFVRDQVTPQYHIVYDERGPVSAINPGPVPKYPATVLRKICPAKDLYSADPIDRSEVWEDLLPTASNADLFAACPQIRTEKEREIRSGGSQRLLALAGPYTAEERETWATQHDQAEAWMLDPECDCAMIRQMAAARGITIDSMVAKIMENVVLFEMASGQILGIQQRLLDQIEVEQDFGTLVNLEWP